MAALHYTVAEAAPVAPAPACPFLVGEPRPSAGGVPAESGPVRVVRPFLVGEPRPLAGGIPAWGEARAVRLPEAVYRRRRRAVAAAAAVVVTLVLTVGRPDGVPPGEANPWSSVGAALEPGPRLVIDGGAGLSATGGAESGPGQRAVVDRAASGAT